MPIHNSAIAEIFSRLADLLEIKGENPFRIRAYRNAARTVGSLSPNVADLVKEGQDLSRYSGIGKDLAGKIAEIVNTGKLTLLEETQEKVPKELSELMQVAGLGPKRVKTIYEQLGVTNKKELKQAAEDGKISELDGFGEKTEQSVLEELQRISEGPERRRISIVEDDAESILGYLKKSKKVKQILPAGSYRRKKETVRDLDILATCQKDTDIMDRFTNYDDVEKVISKGTTRSTVLLRSGLQVDLRVVPEVSYGAALQYFTGSVEHNVAVRKIAVRKNLKINEYGVFKDDQRIAGKTEEEVYKKVGLRYIEPELREDRGEIGAAQQNSLPRLVTRDDIRGDLHSHTVASDGYLSIEQMAQAARKRGYEYLAISDHSQRLTVANGLTPSDLRKQSEKIDELNAEFDDFTILKSVECDIMEDGSLDLPDEVLAELDLTTCSLHYMFNLSADKQTDRVLKAMDNPYFNILGHPTGRMINERPPYQIDIEKIMTHAKGNGCFLELNSNPYRLDINDTYCKAAKDMGLKIALCTDAHHDSDLDFIRFGIGQARRGWLEAGDIINTRSLKELKKLLKR